MKDKKKLDRDKQMVENDGWIQEILKCVFF